MNIKKLWGPIIILSMTFLFCFCDDEYEFSKDDEIPLFYEDDQNDKKEPHVLLIPSGETIEAYCLYYREHAKKILPRYFIIKTLQEKGKFDGIKLDVFDQLYNELNPEKFFTQYLLYRNKYLTNEKNVLKCALFIDPKNTKNMTLTCDYGTIYKRRYHTESMWGILKRTDILKDLNDKQFFIDFNGS